jgi:hypothetical protein
VCLAGALALAAVAIMAPAARARDFCAGVKRAIAHAGSDFAALRVAGPPGRAAAQAARPLIPGARRCEIRTAEGVVEYRCRMTPANVSMREARAAYRRDVARLRHCLAGLRAKGYGDYAGTHDLWGVVSWQLAQGLRAAVAFSIAEEIVAVGERPAGADTAEGRGDDAERDETSSWVVVDKRAAAR